MNWFYAKDGQPAGPVDENEFDRLIAAGEVNNTTLVWRSGLPDWRPYAELRPPIAPPPLPVVDDPVAVTGEPETAAPPASTGKRVTDGVPLYAGFWIRVAASLFDGLILTPVFTVLYIGFLVAFPDFLKGYPEGAHVGALFEIVALSIAAAYQTLFVGRFAATPGKMIFNLRVIQSDGGRISYARALARYFCKLLNGLTFGAAYILVALNPQKCGVHDFLCDTRVIHAD
jgi:uncharacterized RDD family membrane protein YckC